VVGEDICDGWDERWASRGLATNGVALGELVLLMFVELVDLGGLELACRNFLGEENVELVESAVLIKRFVSLSQGDGYGCWVITNLCLRKSEVSPDED